MGLGGGGGGQGVNVDLGGREWAGVVCVGDGDRVTTVIEAEVVVTSAASDDSLLDIESCLQRLPEMVPQTNSSSLTTGSLSQYLRLF